MNRTTSPDGNALYLQRTFSNLNNEEFIYAIYVKQGVQCFPQSLKNP